MPQEVGEKGEPREAGQSRKNFLCLFKDYEFIPSTPGFKTDSDMVRSASLKKDLRSII